MPDLLEAFIGRVRSVEPLPRGSGRRVAIRQKISESENDVRLEEGVRAIPAFLQQARDRTQREIARHTRDRMPTRTGEFFLEVLEELLLLMRLSIKAADNEDTYRVEIQVGDAGARP